MAASQQQQPPRLNDNAAEAVHRSSGDGHADIDGSYEGGADTDADAYAGEEEEEYYDDDDEAGRVEDADWDLRTGDFTKAFNRARQVDAALRRPAAAPSVARTTGTSSPAPAPASMPAMNVKHRRSDAPTQPSGESQQLADLSQRLASLASGDRSEGPGYDASQSVGGQLGRSAVPRKAGDGSASASGARRKDKSDRATHQAVFDPRTLLIIYKMIQSGLLSEVHGVVSTGKEANVYHAYEGPRDEEGKPVPVPVYGSAPLGGTMHTLKDGQDPPRGLALKVYKTAQLSFKDRGIYTKGDTRFEHGYQGNNSRKMVSQWASKEERNLRRLLAAGLRAPKVVDHKDNVLVMDFLGNPHGWASPRLRDAEAAIDAEDETRFSDDELAPSRWTELYAELLASVRIMYQQCRLVHADLSEYNILYHEGHLWIIDVSQSVQHDHESAFDFLRHDLEHIDRYFARHGVPVLGLRRSFDFVISEPAQPNRRRKGGGQAGLAQHMGGDHVHEDALLDRVVDGSVLALNTATTTHIGGESEPELMHTVLNMVRKKQLKAGSKAQGHERAHNLSETVEVGAPDEEDAEAEDAVFKATYIPRTLEDVYDAERDADLVNAGHADQLVYAKVTGLDVAVRKAQEAAGEKEEEVDIAAAQANDDEEDSQSSDSEYESKQPRGHRHEDRDAKKERKQAAKEEKREKRKIKMPKKEKKARVKKTAGTKR